MLIRDIIPPSARHSFSAGRPKIKKEILKPKKLLAGFTILILFLQLIGIGYLLYPSIKPAKAAGTTYYVDNSCSNNGDGSCNGTNPSCTCASGSGQPGPFNSIANMQAKAGGYSGDDNIYLKKGETFREQLTVPSSGTSGHPFTFGAYGSGANPVILGSDLMTTWDLYDSSAVDFTADASLVAYYKFENGADLGLDTKGNVNLTNTNGVTQSATIPSGTYATPFATKSASFLGTSVQSLNATHNNSTALDNLTEFTVVMWINHSGTWGTSEDLADKSDSGTDGFRIKIDNTGTKSAFRFGNATENLNTLTLTSGTWYFFGYTYDQTSDLDKTYYGTEGVQAALQGTGTANVDATGATAQPFYMGLKNGGTFPYTGLMCEVAFFSRVLSLAEIRSIQQYGMDGIASVPNIYKKTGVTTEPKEVIFGTTRGHKVANIGALANNYDWVWVSNVLYVYTDGGDPDTQWPSGIEVGQRNYGIYGMNKDYITINGLSFKNHNNSQVYANTGVGWDVSYCTFDVGLYGFGTWAGGNHLVHHNTGTNLTSFVNLAGTTTSGSTFEYNDFSLCADPTGLVADAMFKFAGSTYNIVRYNYFHDTTKQCNIATMPNAASGNNQFYYNIAYNVPEGFDIYSSSNEIYNNTIITNIVGYQPMGLKTNAGLNIIKNNIFYHPGNGVHSYALFANGAAATNIIDNNLLYTGGAASPIGWTATGENWGGMTFAQWQAHGKYDLHSVWGNPLLVSPSTGNFHLLSTSPAIDAGADLGSTYSSAIMPAGSTWSSSITTADQSLRGSGWEIGAYVYPVPLAPTIGAPSALSFSSIRWNFTDNSNDETGFRLYGSPGAVLVQSPLANLSYLDETGLSASTQYSGRYVKAYNSYGESVASDVAISMTTSGVPGGGPMGFMGTSPATANLSLPAATTPAQTASSTTPTIPSPAPTPQSSIPTTPTITPLFTQTLKYGSRGNQVILLQDTLKELSFFPQNIKSNGNFGPTTLKAVRAFQVRYNIAKPGIAGYGQVGPKTRQALNQLNH